LKKAFFLAAALVSFCRYTKRTLVHVMVHGLISLILTKYTVELLKLNRKKNGKTLHDRPQCNRTSANAHVFFLVWEA